MVKVKILYKNSVDKHYREEIMKNLLYKEELVKNLYYKEELVKKP